MWIGGGGRGETPFSAAKRAERNGSFDHQLICNDTSLLCLLSSGQNNDIIILLLHGDTSIRAPAAHLLAIKFKKDEKVPRQSDLIRCVSKPHLQLIQTDALPPGR